MLRVALFSLVLTGCSLMRAGPTHDARCACTLEPAPGMFTQRDLLPGAVMGFANRFSELYAVVEAVPRAEVHPTSLAAYMNGIVESDPPAAVVTPLTYITISGRQAAWMDVDEQLDNIHVRKRYLVVDNGTALVIAQFWTLRASWTRHEKAIDDMVASIKLDPVEEVVYQNAPMSFETRGLLEVRKDNPTTVRAGQGPVVPHVPPQGSGWQVVKYTSPAGELLAYLTDDPGDGEKHPAVLWVEGGFGGPSSAVWTPQPPDNDQSAAVFKHAGMVVMAPSFRGELDNPGRAENWYGETEDLLAALGHLREVPWVDPERVYLVGHSTGATHVLLAATATDSFRAAFAFGGRADLRDVGEAGYEGQLFDQSNVTEVRIRSPIHWAKHIKRPVYHFEGDQDYVMDVVNMGVYARRAGAPMQAHVVPGGDHFTILAPMKRLVVRQMLADTGEQPAFAFDEAMMAAEMSGGSPPK